MQRAGGGTEVRVYGQEDKFIDTFAAFKIRFKICVAAMA